MQTDETNVTRNGGQPVGGGVEAALLREAFIDLGERELVRPGQLRALGHLHAAAIVRDAIAARKERMDNCPHGSTGPCSICGDMG